MRTLSLLFVVSVLGFAQDAGPNVTNARFENRAYSGDLATQIRAKSATWFGYAVKTIPGDQRTCGSETASGRSVSSTVHLEAPPTVGVFSRVENNTVQKIGIYSADCTLDAGGLPLVWITGVPANASLAYLQTFFAASGSERLADSAMLAISLHDDPQADSILERLSRPEAAQKVREKAIFWLGANRGARGVAILKKLLEADSSEQIRDKAVFALSISKQPDALDAVMRAAKSDSSPHVRSQALFWLAQKAGDRAAATIANAVENDPDTEVKKKAVFALSQLPQDEAIPKLIEIARSQRNREVRKQAFFWLGQLGDPRALTFIEQTLTQ